MASNFLCKDCGSYRSYVVNSRAKSKSGKFYGYVIRSRKCFDCGNKQTTYETTTKPIWKRDANAVEILTKIRNFLDIELGK